MTHDETYPGAGPPTGSEDKSLAKILAERTGERVEEFEYDGEIPSVDEQESVLTDDE
ncbi:hypothetical protein [Halegenticoccus tardaugens]|uniref:hypothetical protein n=1 Tax=Halegenticoccus tardaugens TaxID=2071624 RepID=UPI0013E90922|nr:hypothetical protein [Halegenticoccus tardaugens]